MMMYEEEVVIINKMESYDPDDGQMTLDQKYNENHFL